MGTKILLTSIVLFFVFGFITKLAKDEPMQPTAYWFFGTLMLISHAGIPVGLLWMIWS